jgi:hypothetical protein
MRLTGPAAAIATLTVIAALAAPAAAAGPAKDSGGTTAARSAMTVTGSPASLAAIAAIPHTTGAWAVGEQCGRSDHCPAAGSALILRLVRAKWSRVRAPSPAGGVLLTSVSASSRSNAWAVGSYGGSADKNLFLHWNGRAWRRVSGPSQPGGTLSGVSATSPGNAWAVGSYQSPSALAPRTLALHWTGRSWQKVTTPNPSAGGDQLLAVSALSRTDAWAVGTSLNTSTSLYQTLILHWNGHTWSKVRAPAVATLGTELAGVTVRSRTTAWAVGHYDNAGTFANPLILRWNGRTWRRAPVSGPASNVEELAAVSAASATRAWAVGVGPCVGGSVGCPSHSLILAWNGSDWKSVSAPSVADHTDQNSLTGVAAVSRTGAWTVGSYFPAASGSPVRALLLRRTGATWTKN